MASVPTTRELERAVLDIFRHYGCRPGHVLQVTNLHARWFARAERYDGEDLARGMHALVDHGYVKPLDARGTTWRLTAAGFAAM